MWCGVMCGVTVMSDIAVSARMHVTVIAAAYLECHLRCEYEFVLLKQSTRGVDKH